MTDTPSSIRLAMNASTASSAPLGLLRQVPDGGRRMAEPDLTLQKRIALEAGQQAQQGGFADTLTTTHLTW